MKVLVVDDEFPAREELTFLLEETKKVDVVAKCGDCEEALRFLKKNKVDVVFLDIKMSGMDGISAAEIVLSMPDKPYVVFSTGYDTYAVQAFDLNVADYIMKPYSASRVAQSVERVQALMRQEDKEVALKSIAGQKKISVWSADRLIVLDYSDIYFFCMSSKGCVEIESVKGKFQTSMPLKLLEERLEPGVFLRTHKSFIVNLGKVEEIIPWFNNTFMIKLSGCSEKTVPVSRHYLAVFKKAIGIL